MNICTRLAVASLLLFLSLRSAAQPITLSMPFINNAQPNQVVNLPVSVTGFDSILTMQYVLSWNPQVLKFLTIDNYALPSLDAGDFNANNAVDSGYVRVQYEAPNSTTGASIADGSTIFRLRLRVIGAVDSSSAVIFTEKYPTSFEIARIEGNGSGLYNDTMVGLTQGFVAVGFTVGNQEAQNEASIPVKIFPNPFSESAKVQFELEDAGDVSIQVTDVAGRVLMSDKNWRNAGSNVTTLEKSSFPSKGTYFLIIKTASQYCIRPLFLF